MNSLPRPDLAVTKFPGVRRGSGFRGFRETPDKPDWLCRAASAPPPKDGGWRAQARTIHQNRLSQIAREGGQSTVQHLLDFERQRRLATLVAVVLDLSATITDEAIEMFDKMLGSLFRKSARRYAERFQQSAKAINEKARQFALVGRALIEAKKCAVDPLKAVMAVMPWEMLESSVQEAETLARPEEFDYLEILTERYAMLRKYGPKLLSTFEFRASPRVCFAESCYPFEMQLTAPRGRPGQARPSPRHSGSCRNAWP